MNRDLLDLSPFPDCPERDALAVLDWDCWTGRFCPESNGREGRQRNELLRHLHEVVAAAC